ncbi:MAG TPA: cupredoxin domain-containing protein [Thermoleophilaceae bacterium]|nr:cupredoxin domain-containing protein [Thermoleophilaceae bacterium]
MGARGIAAAALAGLALAASGCAGAETPAQLTAPPKATVVFGDGAYRPAHVRIPVGGRVTFVNPTTELNTAETGGIDTFELDRARLDRQERFDTHVLRTGEAESVEFDTPGTYEFHSSLDSRMKGSVTVVRP